MSAIGGPAPRPCSSCPYRRDVPSGVWAPEEYAKLVAFDAPTVDQPQGVFLCHSAPDRVCAGWCGTHDMDENLGLRIALFEGRMTPEALDACCDYVSPVPLWSSGAEAAAHGLAEMDAPSQAARLAALKAVRARRHTDIPIVVEASTP